MVVNVSGLGFRVGRLRVWAWGSHVSKPEPCRLYKQYRVSV